MAKSKKIKLAGGLRSPAENKVGAKNKACFDKNPSSWETKMENFPKYARFQNITRFLALYEIYKKVLNVKGSIVECGVYHGFGVMSYLNFSTILDHVNLTRKIYGFDSFEGFPAVSDKDKSKFADVNPSDLEVDSHAEIMKLAAIHDSVRFLGHIPKVKLIKGDATKTIPKFIDEHPHLLISLLFLDFDLYEPTKVALENFLPRMPKGAIIAFDELDNPLWPGETQALIDVCGLHSLKLERLPFDPYIGFATIE
jgi:hypothetical protein